VASRLKEEERKRAERPGQAAQDSARRKKVKERRK
jgi:hypothetical protein